MPVLTGTRSGLRPRHVRFRRATHHGPRHERVRDIKGMVGSAGHSRTLSLGALGGA